MDTMCSDIAAPPKAEDPAAFFLLAPTKPRFLVGPRPLTLRASRDHVASPPLDATSAAAVLPKALAANATPEPMTDLVAAPRHAPRRRRAPRTAHALTTIAA